MSYMYILTKAQRKALKSVYDRCPLFNMSDSRKNCNFGWNWSDVEDGTFPFGKPITYRQFRKSVCIGFSCIMVPWCGMWLGIEPDGYTHS